MLKCLAMNWQSYLNLKVFLILGLVFVFTACGKKPQNLTEQKPSLPASATTDLQTPRQSGIIPNAPITAPLAPESSPAVPEAQSTKVENPKPLSSQPPQAPRKVIQAKRIIPDRSRKTVWVHLFPIFKSFADAKYPVTGVGNVTLTATEGSLFLFHPTTGVFMGTAKKIGFNIQTKQAILDNQKFNFDSFFVVPQKQAPVKVCGFAESRVPCRFFMGGFLASYETDNNFSVCYNLGRDEKYKIKSSAPTPFIRVVNVVNLEDYVKGVVSAEMPSRYGFEALKAQAVASRTYASYVMGLNRAPDRFSGFPKDRGCSDLNPTINYQQYVGWSDDELGKQRWRSVDETHSQILKYNGGVILSEYHSNSGGRTLSSSDSDGRDIPYLPTVTEVDISEVRKMNPLTQEVFTYSQADFKNRLARVVGNVSDDKIINIKVLERNNSSGVTKLFVQGSKQSYTLNEKQVSKLLMQLWGKSERDYFDILFVNNQIKFRVYGYGHRRGMSQDGAKLLADRGRTYGEILYYYYTSRVRLESL